MLRRLNLYILLLVLITGTLLAQGAKETSIINLKSNLEFLADDLLEGREATTRGEKLASLYIAKELQKYGVMPFGENGTYFQEFDMQLTGFNPELFVRLDENSKSEKLILGEDFVFSTRGKPSIEYSGLSGEIIFAGYGITATDFDYDDYKNIDVKGKYVLVYDDMPESNSDSMFSPTKHRRYGFWNSKARTAAEHGAIGIFIITGKSTLEYWDYYASSVTRPSFRLYDSTDTDLNYTSIPTVGLNQNGLEKLLIGEKMSAQELLKLAGKLEIPKPFKIDKKAASFYSYFNRIEKARNVIGIIEGTDDNLKNEFVALTAHYDHLGARGDGVYNGADDDGSGTVGVLETARLLSQVRNNKRSVVFIFHTGEEKGLLGSKYLTTHFSWIPNTVAAINMDMIGRESVDSIHCIGSDKLSTEFYNIVEKVNNEGRYFTFDYRFNAENDPNRFYWRSDHVHYAEKEIPIVFFFDYMTVDYHKQTDTVDKINFEKIYKIVKLCEGICLEVANNNHRVVVDKSYSR